MGPLAIAMAGAQMIQGGLGIYSKIMGGNQAARQGRYQAMMHSSNAEIGKINSRIGEINAEMAIVGANQEANRTSAEVERVMGSQVASLAARGIDAAYGSPIVAAASSAAQGATDMALQRANGMVGYAAGLGQKQQALAGVTDSYMSAYHAMSQGNSAQRGAYMGAVSDMLSMVTKFPGLGGGGGAAGVGSSFSVSSGNVAGYMAPGYVNTSPRGPR